MSARRTSATLIACVCASAWSLTGCGGSSAESVNDEGLRGPIVVGVPLSVTGVAGAFGQAQQRGIEYAVEEINDSGMLGDASLEVEIVDVKEDPNQAVTAVRGLVANGEVVAIAGNTLSNHSLAIAPLAEQAGVPLIVANGADAALSEMGDHVYQMDIRQSSYAGKMGEELAERDVDSTAIIMNDDVPAIAELVEVYEESALPDAGISIGDVETVASTATDFNAVVTNALADQPEAIGVLTRAGAVPIITALRQAGYEGVIWSQAALGGGVAVGAGAVAEGVLYTVNAAPGSPLASMEEFFAGYEERYGEPATAFAAQGYDAVYAVALAAESQDCASRECIQAGLTQLMDDGMEGALGPLTFEDRAAIGDGAVVAVTSGREGWVR